MTDASLMSITPSSVPASAAPERIETLFAQWQEAKDISEVCPASEVEGFFERMRRLADQILDEETVTARHLAMKVTVETSDFIFELSGPRGDALIAEMKALAA